VAISDSSKNGALRLAGCDRIYEEKASVGKADRLELSRLLGNMRVGDTLVVWRLDGVGRSIKHLIATVEQLEGLGVGFQSLTESIDTTSLDGKLIFHIFAALAEFERALIRERTNVGLKAARARGRVGGRLRSRSTPTNRELPKPCAAIRRKVLPRSAERWAFSRGRFTAIRRQKIGRMKQDNRAGFKKCEDAKQIYKYNIYPAFPLGTSTAVNTRTERNKTWSTC